MLLNYQMCKCARSWHARSKQTTVRLPGMYQRFDENSHTYFAQQNEATEAALLYAFKQSGFTLPRQTRFDKVSVHFLGIYQAPRRRGGWGGWGGWGGYSPPTFCGKNI